MHSRTTRCVVAAAMLTAVTLTSSVGTALADPPSTPTRTDIVGVGSDTTQGVMGAYAAAYNASKPTRRLQSWDATPKLTNIVAKTGCASTPRPNGSSAGITALLNDTSGCIDFARSSRKKKTDGTESDLTFFAFARDAVSWAHVPVLKGAQKTPATLTDAQLKAIYTCTVTNWHGISAALPATPIKAYLPQAGSGTRSFFEAAIGITDSQVGPCVNSSVEENTGTALAGNPAAIAPYSVANWIAQKNRRVPDVRGGVTLGALQGIAAVTAAGTLNAALPSAHLRLVYNVVKSPAGVVPAAYSALFSSTGYLCKHQSVVFAFGFAPLNTACGVAS